MSSSRFFLIFLLFCSHLLYSLLFFIKKITNNRTMKGTIENLNEDIKSKETKSQILKEELDLTWNNYEVCVLILWFLQNKNHKMIIKKFIIFCRTNKNDDWTYCESWWWNCGSQKKVCFLSKLQKSEKREFERKGSKSLKRKKNEILEKFNFFFVLSTQIECGCLLFKVQDFCEKRRNLKEEKKEKEEKERKIETIFVFLSF